MERYIEENSPHLAQTKIDANVVGRPNPTILTFVFDGPNLVTLTGLALGLGAIYFALSGNFQAAAIALLWAVLMDWYDGIVARLLPGRSNWHRSIGLQMDSLVDLVTSAVAPAIMLLSVGSFSLWFYPGAFAILLAGVLRLAYFNVFGVDGTGKYLGLTIDNTPLVLGGIFLFKGFLSDQVFAPILYAAVLVLAIFHVAPVRTPKVGYGWYYAVTAYAMLLTGYYSYRLLTVS